MATAAFLFGMSGFALSRQGCISLPEDYFEAIPLAQHHRFMAVWFAPGASYLFGLVGGLWLIFSTWNRRGRPAILSVFPRSGLEALRVILIVAAGGVILWFRFFRH